MPYSYKLIDKLPDHLLYEFTDWSSFDFSEHKIVRIGKGDEAKYFLQIKEKITLSFELHSS